MAIIWPHRPTQLGKAFDYANAHINELTHHYLKDGSSAAALMKNWYPTRPPSAHLRTVQWNVHYMEPPFAAKQQSHQICDLLLKTQADVIILNELYMWQCDDTTVQDRLARAGYKHCIICDCSFPTAVFVRHAATMHQFALDEERSAAVVEVGKFRIVATHLDHVDAMQGAQRKEEMEVLLQKVPGNCIIAGDFNQQREQDYRKKEWEQIMKSKRRRSSPADDGVATLLSQHGFQCCYDEAVLRGDGVKDQVPVQVNWDRNHPPPSTHWSGTIIDYAYFKGSGLSLAGLYVMPYNHSDHRMIICDWRLEGEE